jgi:hypothetical protein
MTGPLTGMIVTKFEINRPTNVRVISILLGFCFLPLKIGKKQNPIEILLGLGFFRVYFVAQHGDNYDKFCQIL